MKPYVTLSVVSKDNDIELGGNFTRILLPSSPSEWCIAFIGLGPLYKELWKFWLSGKFLVTTTEEFYEKYYMKVSQHMYGTKQTDDVEVFLSDEQLAVDTAKFIADWYENNQYLLVLYSVTPS